MKLIRNLNKFILYYKFEFDNYYQNALNHHKYFKIIKQWPKNWLLEQKIKNKSIIKFRYFHLNLIYYKKLLNKIIIKYQKF